jgi:hypothetical protein
MSMDFIELMAILGCFAVARHIGMVRVRRLLGAINKFN